MNYAGYQGMYDGHYHPHHEWHHGYPHHYYHHPYSPYYGGGAGYAMNQPGPNYGGYGYNQANAAYGGAGMGTYGRNYSGYNYYQPNLNYGGAAMNAYGPGGYNYYQPQPYYGGYGNQPMGIWPNIFAPGYFSYLLRSPRVNNFFRAVGMVTVGMLLVPSVARVFRPLAVSAVEGALSISEEVKNIFADAKEDVEDIFAEAKWDDEKREG